MQTQIHAGNQNRLLLFASRTQDSTLIEMRRENASEERRVKLLKGRIAMERFSRQHLDPEFEAQITRCRESESRDGSPGDPLVNHASLVRRQGWHGVSLFVPLDFVITAFPSLTCIFVRAGV